VFWVWGLELNFGVWGFEILGSWVLGYISLGLRIVLWGTGFGVGGKGTRDGR